VVGTFYVRFGIWVHPTLSRLENRLWFTKKHSEAIDLLCMKKPACMEEVFIKHKVLLPHRKVRFFKLCSFSFIVEATDDWIE
jgi:hypothetical protein